MKNFMLKYDKWIALVFAILTVLFIAVSVVNESFFEWTYARHQNMLSWYIRPIFLIPFCYFAYKRSWAGISVIIFCIFTSMFWFPQPAVVSESAVKFLEFEMEWLYEEWDLKKWLLAGTVPLSLFALGLTFWKRNLLMGIGVMVLIAAGKIMWSLYNAGESGKSILVPAILGLVTCIVIVYLGFRRIEKKK
ncbi:hypothetical protein LJC57_09375 [Parabacteroides sp. OttesenSCG-928-G07]|nr:hypothetical protein [Parabacteroides sp. OttesenSCG-928-G21]MDL2278789.1 hypothetical protein [Parabacteroides sp. OttesenSCG-928-G07]